LHSEELHKLYRSLNIIRVMKSRRLGWAGHVALLPSSMALMVETSSETSVDFSETTRLSALKGYRLRLLCFFVFLEAVILIQ
jgi:hypothetical protein